MRRWKDGDQVLVRIGSPGLAPSSWVRGRVLRAPCEWYVGAAVTVACEDGWRRCVDSARLRPMLHLVTNEKEKA